MLREGDVGSQEGSLLKIAWLPVLTGTQLQSLTTSLLTICNLSNKSILESSLGSLGIPSEQVEWKMCQLPCELPSADYSQSELWFCLIRSSIHKVTRSIFGILQMYGAKLMDQNMTIHDSQLFSSTFFNKHIPHQCICSLAQRASNKFHFEYITNPGLYQPVPIINISIPSSTKSHLGEAVQRLYGAIHAINHAALGKCQESSINNNKAITSSFYTDTFLSPSIRESIRLNHIGINVRTNIRQYPSKQKIEVFNLPAIRVDSPGVVARELTISDGHEYASERADNTEASPVFEGDHSSLQATFGKTPSCVLFVKGFKLNSISQHEFANLFECFGTVTMTMFHWTRHYALVKMSSVREAKYAMKELYGKEPRVGCLLIHYSQFNDLTQLPATIEKAYYIPDRPILPDGLKTVGHLSRFLRLVIYPPIDDIDSKYLDLNLSLENKGITISTLSSETCTYKLKFLNVSQSLSFVLLNNNSMLRGTASRVVLTFTTSSCRV